MEELLDMIYANYRAAIIELRTVELSDYSCSEEDDKYIKAEAEEQLDYMAELLNKVRAEYNNK